MTRLSFCPLLAVLASTLVACAPLRVYYQPGVEVARMERDLLACEVAAIKSAPVANEVRQGPPRYVPVRTHCDSNNTCYTRGGYFLDGEIYTVDTNADLRRRLERQCMGDQGYSFVEVPLCQSTIAEQVPTAATRVMPRLSGQSCAIRNRDGTWQIVDVSR